MEIYINPSKRTNKYEKGNQFFLIKKNENIE
jgi:hypothetical protein